MNLGIHESLEVHELLTFKTHCAQKAKVLQGMTNNQELKSMLQQDIQKSQEHIRSLRSLVEQAPSYKS